MRLDYQPNHSSLKKKNRENEKNVMKTRNEGVKKKRKKIG